MTINRLNQGVTNQVLVKAVSGQTTNLLELQDSTGAVVSSIGPTGALGGTIGNSGLVHINSKTFSAVASQQINGVFSSTFDNYKIMISISTMTGTTDDLIGLQFGTGGTLNTASTYRRNVSELVANGGVNNVNATDNQNRLFISAMNLNGVVTFDVIAPNLSSRTFISGLVATSDRAQQFTTGFFDNTTSFTDFAINKDSATNMTGTIRVYGYQN